MGNAAASLRSAGQQASKRRTLPKAPSHDETAVLNKIAAQEQARMRDLPSHEEINAKDLPLDQLLSKISAAITPHAFDVSRGEQHPSTSTQQAQGSSPPHQQGVNAAAPTTTSASQHRPGAAAAQQGTSIQMSARSRVPIPEYQPSGLSADELAQRQGKPRPGAGVEDTDPGRVQAFVLREVLEAKNKAEVQGIPLDLTPFTQAYGADPVKLEALFKYCAIPMVGRVKTFGHEYAFARPPHWWLPHKSKSVFRSESAVLEATSKNNSTSQGELPAAFQQRRQAVQAPDSPAGGDGRAGEGGPQKAVA